MILKIINKNKKSMLLDFFFTGKDFILEVII